MHEVLIPKCICAGGAARSEDMGACDRAGVGVELEARGVACSWVSGPKGVIAVPFPSLSQLAISRNVSVTLRASAIDTKDRSSVMIDQQSPTLTLANLFLKKETYLRFPA